MLDIENEIKNLPTISSLVYEIKNLNHNNTYDNKKLEELIEKDSLLRSSLLKLSNSKHFGFDSSVSTVSRAINLYGMNFTFSFCLAQALINSLRVDLRAYGCSFNKFQYLNELSCLLLFNWFGEDEIDLQERLVFPLLSHGLGKFLLSKYIMENNKEEEFLALLKEEHDLSYCEKSICAYSSGEISAKILKSWGFDKEDYERVFYLDNPQKTNSFTKDIYILNVIKNLCSLNGPFSKKNIEKAFYKADSFALDTKSLKLAIDKTLKHFNRE